MNSDRKKVPLPGELNYVSYFQNDTSFQMSARAAN